MITRIVVCFAIVALVLIGQMLPTVTSACTATETVCLQEAGSHSVEPASNQSSSGPPATSATRAPSSRAAQIREITSRSEDSVATEVAALADAITQDLKARHLTRPEGDNALEKIERMRDIAPDHDYAINGRRYVARIYVGLANWQAEKGNTRMVLQHLMSARDIEPAIASTKRYQRLQQAAAIAESATATTEPESEPESSAESGVAAAATNGTERSVDGTRQSSNGADELSNPAEEWVVERNTLLPEMVAVPAGRFDMGSERLGSQSLPVREVTLPAFSISRFEVTVAQYRQFTRATGRKVSRISASAGDILPVTGVSWNDAMAYTEWLSAETGRRYRLPSEAEWEYSARAGTDTDFFWGAQLDQQANCVGCDDRDHAAPLAVGSYDANDFGLFDMHGNVWEWVLDCWEPGYAGAPADGSARQSGVSCSRRVLRGGSWYNLATMAQSAYRGHEAVSFRDGGVGFRVVHDGL